MKHASHDMHANSLSCYQQQEPKLSKRAEAILEWIREHGPRTDRQVMEGMGFREPNNVRPRITELIDAGKLMEVCSVKCPVTGVSVRKVDLRRPRQEALFS